MESILITGGAGFIGSHLCRDLLEDGYKVTCFDSLEKGDGESLMYLVDNPNFKFVLGDLTSESDVARVVKQADGIIHLGGIVGLPACKKRPTLSYDVNVNGTKNIIKYRSKSQRLVNSSTGSVYGRVEDVCVEESPLNPQSEYGVQKKKAEDLVSEQENTISFRFATGFGTSPSTRVNLLVNDLVYQAVHNKTFSVFEADAKRTFIPAREMARSLMFGLKTEHEGVYNCGSEKFNKTKREIAELIKAMTGCTVFYGEFGVDGDLRDYAVSYQKLRDIGFEVQGTMEDEIRNLIKAAHLISNKNPRLG